MKSRIAIESICFTLFAGSVCAQNKQSLPNIIYILADDLGYGDLGCYGQQIIKTPNIDKLASKGMLFTQHYAGSTVSAPSRSSLMTGLHTGHTFVRGNIEVEPEGQISLPENTYTLVKMLKDSGYKTGVFGKWGLGAPGSVSEPNKLGFDEFYGFNCQKLAHNHYPYYLWENQSKVFLSGNVGSGKAEYAPDLIHQHAIQFLNHNKENRFFLFLSYTLPHAELSSPNDTISELYQKNIPEALPYKGVDEGNGYKNGYYGTSLTPHSDFASMITRLDAYVGDVMNNLNKLGIEENTLVIFTSDNGPHCEGGADPEFFKSSGSLRGIKRDLYEGGIRVPMIACWPQMIKAGVKSNLVSAFWDVMPTFKELTKSNIKFKTDGNSFLPELLSKHNQKKHEYLYWEFHEMGGSIAVRMDNWKGIKLNYGKDPNAKMLLFDLSTDIHEDNDLSETHPEIVAKMEQIIKKSRTNSDVFNFGRK